MKMHRLSMLAAAGGLVMAACAGELKNPERFEKGFSAAGEADAGADGDQGNTGAQDGDNGANGDGENGGGGNTTGGGENTTGGGNTGASCDVQKLFAAKCATAGCHGAAAPAAKLDLETAMIGARYLDKPASAACSDFKLIDSAAPEKSLIYVKVTDTPQCGPRMPFGTPLSAAEQACILEWVKGL